jgi:hypothetical protein
VQGALLMCALGSLMCAAELRAQEMPQAPLSSLESGAGSTRAPEAPLPQPQGRLTLRERFKLEVRVTFGPSALIIPAAEAGVIMARPPHNFPHDWRDGAGGFARNYGADLGRHTAGGLVRFATAAVDGEDPRYYPSHQRRVFPRFVHALAFTISDRSDGGHRAFALSDFTGAAAAGFAGMPYEPSGFNDTTHAMQRAGLEFATFGAHNLITEFSPELYRMFVTMHLPGGFTRVFVTEDPGKKP